MARHRLRTQVGTLLPTFFVHCLGAKFLSLGFWGPCTVVLGLGSNNLLTMKALPLEPFATFGTFLGDEIREYQQQKSILQHFQERIETIGYRNLRFTPLNFVAVLGAPMMPASRPSFPVQAEEVDSVTGKSTARQKS